MIGVSCTGWPARCRRAIKDVSKCSTRCRWPRRRCSTSRRGWRALPGAARRVLSAGASAGGRAGQPSRRPPLRGRRTRRRPGAGARCARARCPSRPWPSAWGATRTARIARLRREGRVEVEQDLARRAFGRSGRRARGGAGSRATRTAQAEVLGRLRAAGGRARVPDVVRDRPSLRGALDRLVEQGAIAIEEERAMRAPEDAAGRPTSCARAAADQARVLESCSPRSRRGLRPFLLHGVTGSGKTEVYFRAIERSAGAGPGRAPARPGDRASRRCSCARRWGASARRSPCCTASCRRASGTTSGGACARARRASSSARARRCSRRWPSSA